VNKFFESPPLKSFGKEGGEGIISKKERILKQIEEKVVQPRCYYQKI